MILNPYIKISFCTSAVDPVSPGPRRRRPRDNLETTRIKRKEHALRERNTHIVILGSLNKIKMPKIHFSGHFR